MSLAEQQQKQEAVTLDHLADLPRSERAVRVLILGEFSAGKSSLVNLLIGNDLLPTGVLATTQRLSKLHYADRVEVVAVSESGQRQEIDASMAARAEIACHQFDIGIPCERLREVVLVDTPGFADPNSDPVDVLEAANLCDVAIWCTRAQQAWRHSEREVWLSLPPHLRDAGLLIVTRGDHIKKESDRNRLMTRLKKEAGEMFHGMVLMSVLDAMKAQGNQPKDLDAALWKTSGGEDLASELLRCLKYAVKRGLQADVDQEDPSVDEGADGKQHARQNLENGKIAKGSADADVLLSALMPTIDGCQLAACIDLDLGQLLALSSKSASSSAEVGNHLASLAVSLFGGAEARPIRDGTIHIEADTSKTGSAIETITIQQSRTSYIFCRLTKKPRHAIVLAGAEPSTIIRSLGVDQVKIKQLLSKLIAR